MNSDASSFVHGVDLAFYVILGISLFFLVGITFAMVYFIFKYNKKKHPKPVDVQDNMKLEIIWTVIPTLLVLVMFYFGWAGYRPMRSVPDNAIPLKAIARMWQWKFEYPNGKSSNTLVVPLNKPVLLNLFSEDVIHSLFIPSFRIKEDVVPKKNNYMWFKAERAGTYDILCADYCGLRHSYMLSKVEVKSLEDYIAWYNTKDSAQLGLEPVGLQIIKKLGCNACHSFDGSKVVGPSFKNLYGTKKMVETGGKKHEITADDNYIRKSIYDPTADVSEGFNPVMPSFKDRINDTEIQELINYLKTLK